MSGAIDTQFYGRVYFAHSRGFVKIGYTVHPFQCRAEQLSSGFHACKSPLPYPPKFTWHVCCMAAPALERDLHLVFADLRAVGEWFRLEGDLLWLLMSLRSLDQDSTRANFLRAWLLQRFPPVKKPHGWDRCLRITCGHVWKPEEECFRPPQCPACKSVTWDQPRWTYKPSRKLAPKPAPPVTDSEKGTQS